MTPAYLRRLERLGAYSDRDQATEIYRRNELASGLRFKLQVDRQYRAMDRTRRESDAIERHKARLEMRRISAYARRFAAIRDRVSVEHRIRPPGKGLKSHWRRKNQLEAALAGCPEYRALQERQSRTSDILKKIRSCRRMCQIQAGVLAIDDRATRHTKVRNFAMLADGDRARGEDTRP